MSKQPRSRKAETNRLKHATRIAASEVKRAMKSASEALDQQSQQIIALRRLLLSERAQVIYYTEKYRAVVAGECLELVAVGFLDLSEEQQEKYIKLALVETTTGYGIKPHDPAEIAAVTEKFINLGKKIIQ